MQTYRIYRGGIFIDTPKELEVQNPFTGEVFAKTFFAGIDDLTIAIEQAQKVEEEMSMLPAFEKYKILMDVSAGILKEKEALAELIAQEAGKPFVLAIGEVERTAQTFLVAAEEAKRIPGEYMRIDWTLAGKGKEGWVKYFPIGLIAGIAPFNFPLNLAAHKIAPAIASGCPIILKPASSTPLSILALADIIDRTSLPKGALSILPMDRKIGNLLVTDDRFKLLTFTGSPEVGWKMKANAGKKKVILELGGNAGLIISESADLDLAVKKAVIGAFSYQGQVCIHTQRILVHENVFEAFVNEFVSHVNKLKSGSPLDNHVQITAMIDENNAKRVEQWVDEAVKEGAVLLTGGFRDKAYYAPTVLTNTNSKMKVNSCEVFGPVVTIERYTDFKEAVAIINNSDFGLQAGVFTDKLSEMNWAFEKINAGGVIINDVPTFRVDHMPYGGVKDSGIGREGVKYAIFDMLESKLLVKNIF